jgi:ABC-type lipoprotein release transport system permease subunit
VGIAIGVAVAAVATRSLQGLLFGVALEDGVTYASVIALVFAVVLVAAYVPARRAGGVDPLTLLRRG